MPKHPANRSSLILLAALLCALWASAALAQTSALTYQGQLNINGGPANGTYDLQFKLFDALTGGTQVSITNTATNLLVTNGLFTITLDFGSSAFPGAARWLEISVRPAGGGTYTTLSPRQLMASTPYSVRSLAATSADGLSVACVNCVTSSQIGSLPTGSSNYIQNSATQQASSNFNISGNGVLGGNLGIGTNSPFRRLTVQTAAALGSIGLSHTNGTVEIGTYVNAGGGWLQTHTNHPLFFATNNVSAQMTLTTAGNIGIGTTSPTEKLHVAGNVTINGNTFLSNNQGVFMKNSSGADKRVLFADPANILRIGSGGTTGFAQIDFDLGNASTVMTLAGGNVTINGNTFLGNTFLSNNQGVFMKNSSGADKRVLVADTNNVLHIGSGGALGFDQIDFDLGANGNVMTLVNGRVKVPVLQITGGSDLSEQFDIHSATSTTDAASSADIQPGLVVSIDPDNPGKLVVSHEAYDRKVAGIISGAGGVKTGMMMGQIGSVADGKQPIALTGRVYCWVDAANGPILPGDLLTTSPIPGHAMKVTDHTKAQGAIIGKAMTALREGKGLVLVLVALQ